MLRGLIFFIHLIILGSMIVSQSKVEDYIEGWKLASKPELRARLANIKKKSKTTSVVAEIKAITALLS